MSVVLVTGNDQKVLEARDACDPFGIEIVQEPIDIDEIQHQDPVQIALHKARSAYALVKKPLLINDTSWNIPALRGFPGGYMKDVYQWFDPEDFITLVASKPDRRISCIETVVYIDDEHEEVFHNEYWGEIADAPRGDGKSIEQVAIFNGKTLAEHHNEGKQAFDRGNYIWHHFATWYTERMIGQAHGTAENTQA